MVGWSFLCSVQQSQQRVSDFSGTLKIKIFALIHVAVAMQLLGLEIQVMEIGQRPCEKLFTRIYDLLPIHALAEPTMPKLCRLLMSIMRRGH